MSDALTVIRHAERPTVEFPGGATYQPIIGDDTGAGMSIRTGIQTSLPGYRTRLHSHPYVEVLTVIEGRGEAWLDGEDGVVASSPGCRSRFQPIGCTDFARLGTSRSSLSASTLLANALSTTWSCRPTSADLFLSRSGAAHSIVLTIREYL